MVTIGVYHIHVSLKEVSLGLFINNKLHVESGGEGLMEKASLSVMGGGAVGRSDVHCTKQISGWVRLSYFLRACPG